MNIARDARIPGVVHRRILPSKRLFDTAPRWWLSGPVAALRPFRRTSKTRSHEGGEDSYERIADARWQRKNSREMSTCVQNQEDHSQNTIDLHSHEPGIGNGSQRAAKQRRDSE